ncbi:MAG: glycosyl hydrolase family 28-related protein [Cyclobacteriaceae bacterium]
MRLLELLLVTSLSLLSYSLVFSQVLPSDRSTDWSVAGIDVEAGTANEQVSHTTATLAASSSPSSYDEFNFVTFFGGDNSGRYDNANILQKALDQTPAGATIYFPSGIYLFKRQINVPSNKVIKGVSPYTTLFRFDLSGRNENLFLIKGARDPYAEFVPVTNPYHRGAVKVDVQDSYLFKEGDDIEIEQENDENIYFVEAHKREWAQWAVGQLMRVDRVMGSTLHLDRPLSIDYNSDLKIRLSKTRLIKDIKFETFSIERLDNGIGANFFFTYAANCQISCVRSTMATREHVRINKSRNCTVKGSYFFDAQYHCGGGAGYGILLSDHPNHCLVYNNIFSDLRHSIVVKEGANENVVSYNYSIRPKISDGRIANKACYNPRYTDFPDISVHGHYSFMNLFEHNVVHAIHSADNWGPSGPGTTFFRNLVESRYGLKISMRSEKQNVIGNVVPGGIYLEDDPVDTFIAKNRRGGRKLDTSRDYSLPLSLYLPEKPDFYGEMSWPSIGPYYPVKLNSNPAKARWERNNIFDKYCCGEIPGLESQITYEGEFVVFYERNEIVIEHLYEKIYDITLIDSQGRILKQNEHFDISKPIVVNHSLPNGLYVLNLRNKNTTERIKLIVN